MILNLTGQHIITIAGVYPATIPAPTVRLLNIPPDYPTPAEILADLGIPAGGVTAITGTPIRVAPILDGIEGFPDIPSGVVAVFVPPRIAEAMRRLRLTVRRGVAVLTPALQRWLTADDAIRLATDHAAAIRSLPGTLTWADMLNLYDDLTGMHDAPGLHRESPEHPADTAILRLMDETGASYLRCEAYRMSGSLPRMKMTAHIDRDVVWASGAGWSATMSALGDELRAPAMLPPERLDGGGR